MRTTQFDKIKRCSPCPVIIDGHKNRRWGGQYNPTTDIITLNPALSPMELLIALIHEIKHAKDRHRNINAGRVLSEYRAFMLMVKYALRYGSKKHKKRVRDWVNNCFDAGGCYAVAIPMVQKTNFYKKLSELP